MNCTNGTAPRTNTKIYYLYRDAGNYKVYNDCIIQGALTDAQQEAIFGCLEEGTYFIPSLVGLPEKRFEVFDPVANHPWFELDEDSFEVTSAQPNVSVTADDLVASFCYCKDRWMELVSEKTSAQIQMPSFELLSTDATGNSDGHGIAAKIQADQTIATTKNVDPSIRQSQTECRAGGQRDLF